MLGGVERISYDGEFVRLVEIRLPLRGSSQGQLLSIRTCERIGQGSFGTVYRAVCDGYPRLALKIATGKAVRLRQELDVLVKVCTKGKLLLPRFEFGAINKTGDLIIVGMELCVPSTLHDLLLVTRLTNEADMLFLAHQVLQAVACVHEQRCIHRDVKLQNFVFDLDGNLKLIDFGLASSEWNPPPGDVVAGTVSFMAPEMAHNALHRDQRVSVGASADVWSAGIVLFSIFTQRNPYPPSIASLSASLSHEDGDGEDGGAALSTRLNSENVRLLRRVAAADWRWPVGCSVSNELRQLVEFILVCDPVKRPDVLAILNKPIWNSRRRAPPTAVSAFLGVQDDFLLSHDEAHLLRAVEQRSADVTASLMGSRANSPGEGEAEEAELRASLKFVAREETAVGGVPTHQLYDVRLEAKRKRPLREISVVIAEETAKGLRRCRSKRARQEDCSASRGNSCASSRVNSRGNSRATSPVTQQFVNEGEKSLTKTTRNGRRYRSNPQSSSLPPEEVGKPKTDQMASEEKMSPVGLPNAQEEEWNATNHTTQCLRHSHVSNECDNKQKLSPEVMNACAMGGASDGVIEQRVRQSVDDAALKPAGTIPARITRKKLASEWMDATGVVAMEMAVRALAEKMIFLQLECIFAVFRVTAEEKQEWFDMIWLAEEQRKSAAHPHRFKETTRVSKKYQYGFVCDMCDYEFLPVGKSIYFFHCSCGRDLCVDCHQAYNKQCSCSKCGTVYENSVVLREHYQKGGCAVAYKNKKRPVGAPAQVNTSNPATSKKTVIRTHKAVRGFTSTTTASGPTTKASTVGAAKSAPKREAVMMGAGNAVKEETVKETTPSSLFSRPINTMPEGKWKPMERLSVSHKPIQPTPEEREVLLNGDWIRHFHLFPTEEDAEPIAFTYHIQPGRTGAIFLNHDFSMHSAVISVLERQMLIVDYVDTLENSDAARVVSLGNAKCLAESAYNLLQRVVAYDCNMMKQHRAPGTISIYRTPQTAIRCQGEPFVYVRWFRFDVQHSLSAFLLSNGAVQVLVSDQYELRWFDENRKFLLRSNGVCEMVDDATFALASDVSRLLYDDF
ncbi:protein kinase [Trypanosoma rangeli SC58]|uniref:Protein kinase n=1 Tax=Trypanosoma rangeli SC58 TaxID=429131 RepID=A0A061IV52_TRYRA|nr:protein kinase [Trypanosoma rangeli SC58]